MENDIPPAFRKWMKQCVKEEFGSTIEEALERDNDSFDIAQKVIHSKEMKALLAAVRTAFNEQCSLSSSNSVNANESRPQTSMSFASDLSADEWGPLRGLQPDHHSNFINRISYDKPVHVRLAGYESLLNSELTNIASSQSWDILLKALRDGIADESRPIFEASLQAHAKLLNGPQSHDAFTNLLSAFNAQYHSRRLHSVLPSFASGINFKIFLHEKLFLIMHLIMQHQEEVLKGVRNIDRSLEEMIEQLIHFLSSQTFSNSTQIETLNTLNVVSVLQPQASWSRKWIHSLATRKTLMTALGKFPALLQHILYSVRKGFTNLPGSTVVSITDEPAEVHISGDTVEASTFLHSLCLLTQLCSNNAGRLLLSEIQLDEPFSVSDFMLALLNFLNDLSMREAPSGAYKIAREALQSLLKDPPVLYDVRFHDLALSPLLRVPHEEGRIYPHTMDIMTHMLDTDEGSSYMVSTYSRGSANLLRTGSIHPAAAILEYTSNLLRQPFSVMNVEHVVNLFEFIGRMFEFYEVYGVTKEVLESSFYPAITYLYHKMAKYSTENENKIQILDRSAKGMLLKVVSIPLGLQALTREPLVFEELLQGSLVPLRASWSCSDVIGFVSSAALLRVGFKLLLDLTPHILSPILGVLCNKTEDPQCFYDPWDNDDVNKFSHILRVLSLNASCFITFMENTRQGNLSSEEIYPTNLTELLRHSVNIDSPYHYLGLLALKILIHNLDAYVYLQHMLNFQEELLKLQEQCIIQSNSDGEQKTTYIIEECSLLRHQVLSSSHYIGQPYSGNTTKPEDNLLFSTLPPSQGSDKAKSASKSTAHSELGRFLQESKPGLRDTSWVSQARKAHRTSSKESLKNSVLVELVDQMHKAVPAFEVTGCYKWPETTYYDPESLAREDIHGIDLALHYAEQNRLMQNTLQTKANLRMLLQNAHGFLGCSKPNKFEGFDWFVATVFIICGGNMDKCKTFITQIIQFPSALYVWPALGRSICQNLELPFTTQFVFAQLLEGIVNNEFPTIRYTLRSNCGVDWWMICDGLISQCFWGMLPWSEIVHFFAVCVLYPPDYTLYFCVTLLHQCQHKLMRDVTTGRMWPEHMFSYDYRCHDHFSLMDRLAKRHRNKVLNTLTLQEVNLST